MNASAPVDPRLRMKIIAAYAVIYLVWGSTFLAIRLGVRELPPMMFGGLRFLLTGALLCALALWWSDRFPRTSREWRYMLLFSLLMITFSNGISTIALVHIPSNEGALLSAGSALWIALLGALGPRGHELTVRGTIGLLLGGTWLLGAGLASGELPRWHWHAGGMAAMVYLAVLGSALAYTSYSWLLKHSPADRVGTFAFVNPAVAAVLGWAVLDEALAPTQVAGMLVVLLGVALVTLRARVA